MIERDSQKRNWISRKNIKRRLVNFLLFFTVLILIISTIFGKNGLLRVLYLKYTVNKEQEKTNRLVKENEKLEKEIKLLKDDNGYIEYIARRDLGLVKSQDIIYFFKDKNEENQR